MHAANLGDRREKVVYPAWWENRERLLVRRIGALTLLSKGLTEAGGLPAGMMVKREATEFARDMLILYIDGAEIYRRSNLKPGAAEDVVTAIRIYQDEKDNAMTLTAKGWTLLRDLAATENGIKRAALGYRAIVADALARKEPPLAVEIDGMVCLTKAGADVLRSLPDFDQPINHIIDTGDMVEPESVEMPFVAGTCEESMTEDQLWAMTQEARAAMDAYDAATIQQLRRELPAFTVMQMDELRSQFEAAAADGKAVKLVLGEGVGLGDVVQRDGAEMMAMGGVVIHLEIKLPLLFELYPPLRSLLDGFEAIGATVTTYGDLNITVERAECEDE